MNDPIDASSDEEPPSGNVPSQPCFVLHFSTSKAVACPQHAQVQATPSGKRKRSTKKDLLPLPSCIQNEPEEWGLWRAEAFHYTWEIIEETVKNAFDSRNAKVFKSILKFVHDSIFRDAQLRICLSSNSSANGAVRRQLNAALVCLRNVDSSDHTTTFIELKRYLHENNCHVANLLPQNFSNKGGMGSALYSMLKQIVKTDPDTTDLDILSSWHKDPEHVKCPIVIIIEDAELCSPLVLADFIITLSEWQVDLPLVLILGMTTSVDAMQKLLPVSAARRLHVSTFVLPSPDEYLESAMKAALFNPSILFTMCHDTLKFLIVYYRKYDSTVTFFLRALRMACMEHFWSQPLSFLCSKSIASFIQTQVDGCLQSFKMAFHQYASHLPSFKSTKFDANHDIHKELNTALDNLHKQKVKWSMAIRCVFASAKISGVESMKILSELLEVKTSTSIQGSVISNGKGSQLDYIEKNSAITAMLKRVRDGSELMIQKLLRKFMKLTEDSNEWRVEVQSLLQKLMLDATATESYLDKSLRRKNLPFEFSKEEDNNIVMNKEESIEEASKGKGIMDVTVDCPSYNRSGGYATMSRKTGSRIIGRMVTNLIEKMIGECLVPLDSLLFHEIICFRDVGSIKQLLIGEPRKIIQGNIQYPQKTLQCDCCSSIYGNLSDSMNDSSIFKDVSSRTVRVVLQYVPLARLHEIAGGYYLFCIAQRYGDQVNLFDLYQSFSSVFDNPGKREPGNEKKRSKSPRKLAIKTDKALLQARFCKAVSELQMVGMIHMPSKKRPDFVQLAM